MAASMVQSPDKTFNITTETGRSYFSAKNIQEYIYPDKNKMEKKMEKKENCVVLLYRFVAPNATNYATNVELHQVL